MILGIESTFPGFKSFKFTPGLNIIVAERDENSGTQDTRNGTGKTSLIELIHFILADTKSSSSDFHSEVFEDHDFTLQISNAPAYSYELSKSVVGGKEIHKINNEIVERQEIRHLCANDWFNLTPEILSQNYSPTFGALFAYFVRKARIGGFNSATNNSSRQSGWDMQVNLSYLLNFDWRLPQKLQTTKDEKKAADEFAKMLRNGLLSKFELDPIRMQTRYDMLEIEIGRKRQEISEAKVLDGYKNHEEMANSLTRSIRSLNEKNLADLDLIADIKLALDEVLLSADSDIENMYNEAGIFFPEQVSKRFEQVKSFHDAVANNRNKNLEQEATAAENRLLERNREINQLQSKLSGSLQLLQSGVAIERHSLLQSEIINLEAEFSALAIQIPRLRDVEANRKSLKLEIDNLVSLIGDDVLERKDSRTIAVQEFADISAHLYKEAGELVIGRSKGIAGFAIETNISAKKSGGKSHMQIFCFDLMLAIISKQQEKFPGFLVHDSHIFDGVDGRQVGLALDVAQKVCVEFGIQYIVLMNSDDLEKIKAEEAVSRNPIFDPTPFINPTRLSDTETGGLFGTRI